MNKTAGKLDHIKFLAENGLYREMEQTICRSVTGLIEKDHPCGLCHSLEELKNLPGFSPALYCLLELGIITDMLLSGSMDPDRPLLPVTEWIDRRLVSLPWKCIHFPVAGAGTDPGDVYLLAGTFAPEIDIPLVPSWVEPLIGTDTFESFQTAEELVRQTHHPRLKGSFHIYPLLKPDNRIKFTGRSAGLPAVLLLLSTAENRKLEPSFSATGCIDSSGSIFPVKGIKEKIQALAEMNFRLILHPASVSSNPDQTSNFVKCVPVSNTDEAWLFAGMYTQKPDRYQSY